MEKPAPKDASLASVKGSTGVDQDRGMCEEKRTDGPIFHSRHLELGRSEMCTCGSREATKGQRRSTQRRRRWTIRESDPPILVRDGNTGHTTARLRPLRSRRRRGQDGIASTALTPGHVDPDLGVKLPACTGSRFGYSVSKLVPFARHPEESGAVIPHAGICEGDVG